MTDPRRISARGLCASAVALLAIALLHTGCHKAATEGDDEGGDEARPNRVVLVHIASAEQRPIRALVETAGSLAPRRGSEARVSAQVEGSVAKIMADVGQLVKAGDPVMEIDPVALNVDARKADAEVGAASASANLARQKLERQKALQGRGIVAGKDVAEAESELAQAEQALANARAAQDLASTRAGRAVAKSPVAGTILVREVALGQFVQPETMLFAVAPTNILEVVCAVPAGVIEKVKTGLDAEVDVPGNGKPVSGRVTLVSPALDAETGAAAVRIELSNAEGSLRPGTLCHARIVTEHREAAVVIPASAVRFPEGEGKPTVAVVDDQSVAHTREVAVGIREEGMVEILDGLKAGEKVVTEGSYGLPDETHVKELAAPAPDAPAAGDDKG